MVDALPYSGPCNVHDLGLPDMGIPDDNDERMSLSSPEDNNDENVERMSLSSFHSSQVEPDLRIVKEFEETCQVHTHTKCKCITSESH